MVGFTAVAMVVGVSCCVMVVGVAGIVTVAGSSVTVAWVGATKDVRVEEEEELGVEVVIVVASCATTDELGVGSTTGVVVGASSVVCGFVWRGLVW